MIPSKLLLYNATKAQRGSWHQLHFLEHHAQLLDREPTKPFQFMLDKCGSCTRILRDTSTHTCFNIQSLTLATAVPPEGHHQPGAQGNQPQPPRKMESLLGRWRWLHLTKIKWKNRHQQRIEECVTTPISSYMRRRIQLLPKVSNYVFWTKVGKRNQGANNPSILAPALHRLCINCTVFAKDWQQKSHGHTLFVARVCVNFSHVEIGVLLPNHWSLLILETGTLLSFSDQQEANISLTHRSTKLRPPGTVQNEMFCATSAGK